MTEAPLMRKATAVWLVENTTLTFVQIAKFCGMHPVEVHGIADGEVLSSVRGLDPTLSGQLKREEITRGEADASYELQLEAPVVPQSSKKKKGARYTLLSRRQDKPNAILWLLKHCPSLKNSQIIRLIGTTKNTIDAVRDRSHWNYANLTASDPVILGLCTQVSLDQEVEIATRSDIKPDPEEGAVMKGADDLRADDLRADDLRAEAVFGEFPNAGTDLPDA